MDNKDLLEQTYKVNYDSGSNFIKQNNLLKAKESFKKALDAAIRLAEQSYGNDAARHRANAKSVASLLEQINAKLNSAQAKPKEEDKKPAAVAPVKPASTPAEPAKKVDVEAALEKLFALEGLELVKEKVKELIALKKVEKIRRERGLSDMKTSNHLVFLGNPGTGKTTVARIIAEIYCGLGIVSKGQCVEVSRADLVAGYVGQTAPKTKAKIEEAMGGVLFIDEAYTLYKEGTANDFGKEAIEELLKAMEDNRGDFVVIVAGYDELMDSFLKSNPGFPSRFPDDNKIHFTDYNGEQLYHIFMGMCKKNDYTLGEGVSEILAHYFKVRYETRDENFSNARDVRNLFENIYRRSAKRVAPLGANVSNEQLKTILLQDLPDKVKNLIKK